MNKLNQSTISFEYYFITATIIFLFPVLIYIKNLIIFYVIFEVIGILILILISFQITNESIKAAILYFFFGFYSTLFLI
jgi:NADH:ubiquinone oxidoreductase subunit 2 (subunit N)